MSQELYRGNVQLGLFCTKARAAQKAAQLLDYNYTAKSLSETNLCFSAANNRKMYVLCKTL